VNRIKAAPVTGSCAAGLIASLCCGGSLIFASIGLGAFWSTFGFSRYIPQVLAAGALSIVVINYVLYRRAAERSFSAGSGILQELRPGMFLSAAIGLAAMAASFIFLEWFNHAVVNPHTFLAHSEYSQALIPGVPNVRLLYAVASFAALALLWALPFPQPAKSDNDGVPTLYRVLRWGVFAATAALIVVLGVETVRVQAPGGHENGQHGPTHQRQH
jgi:hypothetical protein